VAPSEIADPINVDVSVSPKVSDEENCFNVSPTEGLDLFGSLQDEEWDIGFVEKSGQRKATDAAARNQNLWFTQCIDFLASEGESWLSRWINEVGYRRRQFLTWERLGALRGARNRHDRLGVSGGEGENWVNVGGDGRPMKMREMRICIPMMQPSLW